MTDSRSRLRWWHRLFGHPLERVHTADLTSRCDKCGDVWKTEGVWA